MNLFVYRKLNVVINVLIVVICILMLIFLNLNLFKKIIIVTILILKPKVDPNWTPELVEEEEEEISWDDLKIG